MKQEETRWRRYLRFLGADVDADIEDELRFHLEMKERELLEKGLEPREAQEAALAAFGEYDEVRDWLRRHDRRKGAARRRVDRLDSILQDLRYGARKLGKEPAFTAVAVAILALGIGATTAVFSAIDALLLRPLPFADDGRLVRVDLDVPMAFPGMQPARSSTPSSAMSGPPSPRTRRSPDLSDLNDLSDVFTGYTAYAPGSLNLTGVGEPIRVPISMVTPSFFPTLGVLPSYGRPFASEEGAPGAARAAILSSALARGHFGEPDTALGRTIELNGVNYEVVGVMPRDFGYPYGTEVWVPMPIPMTPEDREPFRQLLPSVTVARLTPGTTVAQADSRVRAPYTAYSGQSQRRAEEAAAFVRPFRDQLVGDRRNAMLMLFGATLLVLLVACTNVANLLLSKAALRGPETAMRRVLGADGWRIAQQFLIESLLLSLAGGVAGLVVAYLCLSPLRTLIPPHLVGAISMDLDGHVLFFSLLLALATPIVFGLWPILSARSQRLADATNSGSGRHSAGRDVAATRRGIAVAQVTIASMLLIGSGVMLRSFGALLSVDPGIRAEGVGTLEMTLARAAYATPGARRLLVQGILDRLAADPRVTSAAMVNELPLRGQGGISISVRPEGMTPEEARNLAGAMDLRVTPDYFSTMNIPVLSGRTFSGTGDDAAARELIVNEFMAERFWPGEDPIGKTLEYPGREVEVVGMVGNVKGSTLETPLTAQMYTSLLVSPSPHLGLVARSTATPQSLSAAMREAIHTLDPEQAVYNVKTMREVIAGPLAPRRTNTLLVTLFGALAAALAVIGVYGVLAYDVTQRSRELGIRMALGAASLRILRDVLRGGMRLVVAGIVLGLIAAWFVVRLLDSLLYEISPRDPLAFAAAPLLLLAVAWLAMLIPARRASSIDPAAMIRTE